MSAFARFSSASAQVLGAPWAFAVAVGVTVVWAITGPLFGWSDTWQLIINTGTTVLTFLAVFLIQHTQNRDTKALHLKVDELIHNTQGARDELIKAEEHDEHQMDNERLDPGREHTD